MSKKSPNILLLSLSGIGNFLMQSPVFAALKENFPDSRLTVWVAPRGTKDLAEANPYIDKVIEAPIKGSLTFHTHHTWHLRRGHYDMSFMLHPGQLWKGAAYMYLSGAKKRIAHQYTFRHNKSSSFLLTDSIPVNPHLHDISQNINLLSPLNIPEEKLRVTNYELQITSHFQKSASQTLANLNIPDNSTLIGIHPGSAKGYAWKRWPLANFAKLAALLTSRYKQPVSFIIFGGGAEKGIKQKLGFLLNHQNTKYEILNTTDLLSTAAVINQCDLFISNDSGLMHLAAATGTKTFGLFGPTDENKIGPRGAQSQAIRVPGTKSVYDSNTNYQLGNNPHPTLLKLTPEMVLHYITLPS